MAEITIDIDVICEDCGYGYTGNWYRNQLFVEQCEGCKDDLIQKGYEKGFEDGKNESD